MSAKIDLHIISDASFSEHLRISSYAGGIYSKKPEGGYEAISLFKGSKPEVATSEEGELNGILNGMLALKKLKEKTTDEMRVVTFHCDSLSALQQIYLYNESPDEYFCKKERPDSTIDILTEIRNIIDEGLWSEMRLEHVKGHVPESLATDLEQLNILADRMACQTRAKYIKRLLNPNPNPNPNKVSVVGILGPEKASSENEERILYELAYRTIKQGRGIRLVIDGSFDNPTEHPIYKGAMAATQELSDKGVETPASLTLISPFSTTQKSPYDITLLRAYTFRKHKDGKGGLNYNGFNHVGRVLSQILYGNPSSVDPDIEKQGVDFIPASVIYDLSHPDKKKNNEYDFSLYLKEIISVIKIPLHIGVKPVIEHLGMDFSDKSISDIPINDKDLSDDKPLFCKKSPLFDVIKSILELSQNATGKETTELLHNALQKFGFPGNEASKQAVTRAIFSNNRQTNDTAIDTTIRHLKKISFGQLSDEKPDSDNPSSPRLR